MFRLKEAGQTSPFSSLRLPNAIFLLILLVGLLYRAVLISKPLFWMFTHFLPDDATYYFVVANHWVHGLGLSFVSHTLTNGFQPLWMLLISPIFAVLEHESAVRTVLSLGLLLNAVSAVLLFLSVRILTRNAWAALVAMALFYFNPSMLYESVNGLETSLGDLLVNAVFLWLVMRFRGERTLKAWGFGVLIGLMMLSRMDTVFFAALALFVFLLVRLGTKKDLLVILGVAGLLQIPWLAYNFWLTGSPVPTSGAAYPHVLHQNFWDAGPHSLGDYFAASANHWKHAMTYAVWQYFPFFRDSLAGCFFMLAVLLLCGVVLFSSEDEDASQTAMQRRAELLLVFLPVLAFLFMISVHGFVRWYPRSWYYMQGLSAFCLLAGVSLGKAMNTRRVTWLAPVLILAFYIPLSFDELGAQRNKGYYPWQLEMAEAGNWVRENVPADASVASFNSGIMSFVSGRDIHELGGIIHSPALLYVQEKKLSRYLNDNRIQYIVDFDYSILEDYRRYFDEDFYFHLRLVKRIDLNVRPWLSPSVSVYRYSPEPIPIDASFPLALSPDIQEGRMEISGFYPWETLSDNTRVLWSEGKLSSLAFWVSGERPEKFSVKIKARPFIPQNGPNSVSVDLFLNSAAIGATEFPESDKMQEKTLSVEGSKLRSGLNRLELSYSSIASPKVGEELPPAASGVYRKPGDLALAFERIELLAEQSPAIK